MPRIIPVRIPLLPAGTTTVAMVFHLLAPNASAASRSESGTSRRNCSVWRVTIGISITARAIDPARPENDLVGTTTRPQAKRPTTMEGIPFSRSAT
jgi:hypothetical protein